MNVYLVNSRSDETSREGSPGAFYSVRFFSAGPSPGACSLPIRYRTKPVFALTILQISPAAALPEPHCKTFGAQRKGQILVAPDVVVRSADEDGADDQPVWRRRAWKRYELHRQVEQAEPVEDHGHDHLAAMMKPTVATAFRRGVRIIDASRRTPRKPRPTPTTAPRQIREAGGSFARHSTATRSANVPTTNEIAAASTGPPTAPRSRRGPRTAPHRLPRREASNSRIHSALIFFSS